MEIILFSFGFLFPLWKLQMSLLVLKQKDLITKTHPYCVAYCYYHATGTLHVPVLTVLKL